MYLSEIRSDARYSLKGNWGMAILVTLIAGILGGLVTGSTSFNLQLEEGDLEMLSRLPKIFRTYLLVAASIGGVLATVQFVIGTVVQTGFARYLLNLHDGKPAELRDLFSGFQHFGTIFVAGLLRAVYIFLWTLLFIIPGIIATLRYAMVPFVLAENPGMDARKALETSKYLMDGNKGDLFVLNLTFIGWALLSALTMGIGNLWLQPYINMSYAVFFRRLYAPNVDPVVEEASPNF